MTFNKVEENKIRIITDFNEMKELLDHQATLYCEYLTAYNIKVLDRTITRAEDF